MGNAGRRGKPEYENVFRSSCSTWLPKCRRRAWTHSVSISLTKRPTATRRSKGVDSSVRLEAPTCPLRPPELGARLSVERQPKPTLLHIQTPDSGRQPQIWRDPTHSAEKRPPGPFVSALLSPAQLSNWQLERADRSRQSILGLPPARH